ncbi:MAG: LIC12048 family lipoprotein [Leptospirales bacterium]
MDFSVAINTRTNGIYTLFKKQTGFRIYFIALLILPLTYVNCTITANVEPTELKAEIVEDSSDGTQLPLTGDQPIETHDLFSLDLGTWAKIGSFGIVDPVGTTLSEDFDGDGIINTKETVSNFWVAEYPSVETSIAAPITMKIEVHKTSTSETSEIISSVTSSDVESRRNEGSEKFHQNELARRTTQSTETKAKSKSASGGLNLGFFRIGGSKASSKSVTRDVFKVRPFKNNINRNATSVTSNSAAKNARQYRSDKKSKTTSGFSVDSDAGIVRASLYINNHSVNMPVKISNILCSLLFETSTGEIIPIQSFRLRNADYSIFSVELYGASEFGPYVIELSGLNTAEIEQALAQGHTPKIYLVDYELTHVTNSNYRAALSSSFTGNNLKIVEENAKGRTALIKIIGPFMRELFRVAAFDADTTDANDACALTGPANLVTPGISMKTALDRIACYGTPIEYAHYVFDFAGTELESTSPITYTYGIKSIGGIANEFPCHSHVPGTDNLGNPVTACRIQIGNLTEGEIEKLKMWMVYDNGRYFNHLRPALDAGGNPITFDGTITSLEGLHSKVWAGDNYDVVYLSIADILGHERDHGRNPIESGESVVFNTKWNNDTYGPTPFYPNANATYIGQAALGEEIAVEISLLDTNYLTPNFGIPSISGAYDVYDSFSYTWQKEVNKFQIEDAFDFEINLGTGGTASDWYNIARLADTNNLFGVGSCAAYWNFLTQTFTLCIQIPNSLPGVPPGGLVDIFLRTAPNNAYREVAWPENYQNVKQYKGLLLKGYFNGDTIIEAQGGDGRLITGTGENGTTIQVGDASYTIASAEHAERVYEITLLAPVPAATSYPAGTVITMTGFTGTLKESVSTDDSVIRIIPDTAQDTLQVGTFGVGYALTVGADSGYVVSTARLLENVHTITLQSGITQDHFASEEVSVSANQTKQEMVLYMSQTVVTDWNSIPANAGTGNIPYDGRQLFTANSTGCYFGLDSLNYLSPSCQFYGYDSTYMNYVGGSSFYNDWADSSKFSDRFYHMNENLNQYTLMKETSLSNAGGSNDIAISNNKILIVNHVQNGPFYEIRGTVINAISGSTVGNADFLINTTSAAPGASAKVIASGQFALVVFATDVYDIRGRFVDLTNGTPLGANDIAISTNNTGNQSKPRVAIFQNTALVVWGSNDLGPNNVRGRFIDLSTQLPLGTDDILVNTTGPSTYEPTIAVSGNRALIAWILDLGADTEVQGRIVEMDTLSFSAPDDFLISETSSPNWANFCEVAASNGKAIVVWESYEPASADIIRGRVIDLSSAKLSGPEDIMISTQVPYGDYFPHVYAKGEIALVSFDSWTDSGPNFYDVGARFINLNTGTAIGASEYQMNSETIGSQYAANVTIMGDRALIIWPSGALIRGRFLDTNNYTIIDQNDLIIGKNGGGSSLPSIINVNENVFISWKGIGSLSASFITSPFGTNSYLMSPLVERNYSVKTRLVY